MLGCSWWEVTPRSCRRLDHGAWSEEEHAPLPYVVVNVPDLGWSPGGSSRNPPSAENVTTNCDGLGRCDSVATASRVVVTMYRFYGVFDRGVLRIVGETSQQRQGACRAEETGW
ncbi:hypothetical protein Taro_042161 [Colocasia esculenta]|uniref:Uncharacterized protein n=1 Tax=Colocasia esculenta TaxID=4460 RepID=A0A843WG54_COLES|nr:hypothetical protein [Colocasia esculenta]